MSQYNTPVVSFKSVTACYGLESNTRYQCDRIHQKISREITFSCDCLAQESECCIIQAQERPAPSSRGGVVGHPGGSPQLFVCHAPRRWKSIPGRDLLGSKTCSSVCHPETEAASQNVSYGS